MDDSVLMEIMVEAYPIVVFTKQLEDRSRKIMEILEGEDFRDGQLVSHTLYKFEVEDNVTDRDGNVRVVGHHRKVGLISDTLKKRLLDNGISNKELAEFMQPPKEASWLCSVCARAISLTLSSAPSAKRPHCLMNSMF